MTSTIFNVLLTVIIALEWEKKGKGYELIEIQNASYLFF